VQYIRFPSAGIPRKQICLVPNSREWNTGAGMHSLMTWSLSVSVPMQTEDCWWTLWVTSELAMMLCADEWSRYATRYCFTSEHKWQVVALRLLCRVKIYWLHFSSGPLLADCSFDFHCLFVQVVCKQVCGVEQYFLYPVNIHSGFL